jgi:hypothetical protein
VTTERGIYTGRLIPPIFFGTANNSCPAEVESQMRLYTCDMASPYEGTPPPLSTVTVGHMIGLFDRMYRAPTPLTPAMFGISRSDRLFWVLLRESGRSGRFRSRRRLQELRNPSPKTQLAVVFQPSSSTCEGA